MHLRTNALIAAIAGTALVATPAAAQFDTGYYGDYNNDFDNEGFYDYDADTDWDNLEYEPGEGYHEEEWYDPSDWFNDNPGVAYEYDNWGTDWGYDYGYDTGYYDTGYDYGYYDDFYESPYMDTYDVDPWDYSAYDVYDYPTYDDRYGQQQAQQRGQQQYGQQFDQQRQRDQQFRQQRGQQQYGQQFDRQRQRDQQFRQQREQQQRQQQTRQQRQMGQFQGEVIGLSRISSGYGAPDHAVLRVRTQDGQTRNLLLGDLEYAQQNLPRLQRGDRIAIGGEMIERNGEQLFKARGIAGPDGRYDIPEYEYQRTLRGELVGLQRVALEEGNVDALVAKVRGPQGQTMNVLLGDAREFQQHPTLRPGNQVEVRGYQRTVGGEDTFVVQGVNIHDRQQGQQQRQRDQQRQQQTY